MATDAGMITSRPWRGPEPPSAILAIRLQAFGDVAVTMPYLRALKQALPGTALDLITRRENVDLPEALQLFRRVYGVGGGRSERRQLLAIAPLLPPLALGRYPVVIDLQNNRVSRTIRRLVFPRAWSAFDRFSASSAGERTRRTIEAAGFSLSSVELRLPLRDLDLGVAALRAVHWDATRPLVVLSPSGAFPSRRWPVESYAGFAAIWQRRSAAQFAVLGVPAIAQRAEAIAAAIGASTLNLVGKTTAPEAMGILQRASLVVTEDCGLMHMAWTAGVPTIALFGSSNHVWSAPQGDHSVCLHSGDLPCGACMDAQCRFGDVHCLTRYGAERVVAEAERLLRRTNARP